MSTCANKPINLSNPERIISGFSGGVLLAYGVSRLPGLFTLGCLGLGCGLMYRAVTGHCSVYESLANARLRDADEVERASEDSFPASDPPGAAGSVISRSVS